MHRNCFDLSLFFRGHVVLHLSLNGKLCFIDKSNTNFQQNLIKNTQQAGINADHHAGIDPYILILHTWQIVFVKCAKEEWIEYCAKISGE